MCSGEEQCNPVVPLHICSGGATKMCGCEDKHEIHAMLHGLHHLGPHEICSCQGRRFLSKKEQKEMLEELKKLKGD